MEKDYLISVIIPVYNTYEYLKKCLDSVCVQCCDQIQVVIVDDGSSDGSEQICDEYANQNNDVLVIHEENKGVVHARKAGVEVSSGKYLAFVDSDDWIDNDFFSKLIYDIKHLNVDIIAFDCLQEYTNKKNKWANLIPSGLYGDDKIDWIKENSIFKKDEFVPWIILPHLCTKIISRELVQRYMINVSDMVTFGEDAACFYPCLWNSNKILILDEAPYHYLQRSSSASNSISKVKPEIILGISSCLLKSDYMNDQIREQIKLYTFYLFMLRNYSYLEEYGFVLFPFGQIKANDKIVIYGAGGFGFSLWNYINSTQCVQITAIVDKRGKMCSTADYEVNEINVIEKLDFDYIVIAILNEKISKEVRKSLVDMGVNLKKILYISKECLLKYEEKCND